MFARAHVTGRPRERFLDDMRRRLVVRLLPTLGTLAGATGAAALIDLFRPVSSRSTVVFGLTATALAVLAFASTARRKDIRALLSVAVLAAIVLIVAGALIARSTGSGASPYILAPSFGVTLLVIALPLPLWFGPLVAVFGILALALLCPDTPPLPFVAFVFVGPAGYAIAKTRTRRALRAFRRIEVLTRSLARLRKLQDELVVIEKLEALRVLVGGMAHEINNALAVSLASTEQVVRIVETDPKNAQKAARRAEGGLVRIRQTIDRLRRFALAEQGVLESADLAAMLDFALESAVGRARSGVVIERAYDEGIGSVECHVSGLAEALYQVAKNAVESMPAGGRVRASVRRKPDAVTITVADEGGGIPKARLAKVFDPFYARESAETFTGRVLPPLPGRSGLGLSAVYGLVTAMGGKVEIQSDVGKGTEVTILLPSSGPSREPVA